MLLTKVHCWITLNNMWDCKNFKKFFFTFIHFWKTDRAWVGKGQREGTQNPKQAPGSELSAQSTMWGSNSLPWDHDLSWSRSWTLTDWATQVLREFFFIVSLVYLVKQNKNICGIENLGTVVIWRLIIKVK